MLHSRAVYGRLFTLLTAPFLFFGNGCCPLGGMLAQHAFRLGTLGRLFRPTNCISISRDSTSSNSADERYFRDTVVRTLKGKMKTIEDYCYEQASYADHVREFITRYECEDPESHGDQRLANAWQSAERPTSCLTPTISIIFSERW